MNFLVWIAEHAGYISIVAAIVAVSLKIEHWLPRRIKKYLFIADIFIMLATPLLSVFKEQLDNKWKSVIQEQSKQHNKQINQLTSTNKQIKQEHDKDKQQISELTIKAKVAEEMAYQEYSQYGAHGNKKGVRSIDGVIIGYSPLMDWSKGFVPNDNIITCQCTDLFVQKCYSFTHKYPYYPFSYYYLAVCLKEKNDPLWTKMPRSLNPFF